MSEVPLYRSVIRRVPAAQYTLITTRDPMRTFTGHYQRSTCTKIG